VGLDEADHDVGAPSVASMALLEHPVGLADSGRHSKVYAQPAAPGPLGFPDSSQHLARRRADVEGVALAHRAIPE
jgi:hypothetical protein